MTEQVGQELPELVKHPTTQQLVQYAGASGDFYQIHYDQAFAKSVALPGVILHGLLKAAFLGQLVTDWLGDRSLLKRLQGRFAGMVVPGDDVTCTGTVASKDEATRRIVINLVVTNQRGEKVFNKGVAEAEFAPQRSTTNAA